MLQDIVEFMVKLMIEEFERLDVPDDINLEDTLIVEKHEEQILR